MFESASTDLRFRIALNNQRSIQSGRQRDLGDSDHSTECDKCESIIGRSGSSKFFFFWKNTKALQIFTYISVWKIDGTMIYGRL